MAIEWNTVIQKTLEQAPAILAGAALVIAALRRKLNRIEQKADGNHKAALEEIKKAGKYEGKEEAKKDSRFDQEQLMKAFQQALETQSQRRGKRRTDPP